MVKSYPPRASSMPIAIPPRPAPTIATVGLFGAVLTGGLCLTRLVTAATTGPRTGVLRLMSSLGSTCILRRHHSAAQPWAMTRIAPSTAFADVPVVDVGQGDRINLGVAAIVGRVPKVAEALGALNAALK